MGRGLGHWSYLGEWRGYGSDFGETELRLSPWGLFRLSERASVYGRVPVVFNWRESGDVAVSGGGLGEADLGVRYEVLSIGEYVELPAIALTASALLPTRRATRGSDAPLAVDVTGRGAFVAYLLASIERTFLPWFWRVDFGGSLPAPAWEPELDAWSRIGPGVNISGAVGRELVPGLVMSLVLAWAWESALYVDERRIDGSATWSTTSTLAMSWALDPRWTLQAAVGTALPLEQLGRTRPGQLSGTLGVRWGHIR